MAEFSNKERKHEPYIERTNNLITGLLNEIKCPNPVFALPKIFPVLEGPMASLSGVRGLKQNVLLQKVLSSPHS